MEDAVNNPKLRRLFLPFYEGVSSVSAGVSIGNIA